MNKWLKQRRKLCDEATDGPWEYDYIEPYESSIMAQGKELPGVSIWLDDAPVPDFNRLVDANAKHIASCDPATMRLIYDVVEQASDCKSWINHYWERDHLGLTKALEALRNKVGGDENPR